MDRSFQNSPMWRSLQQAADRNRWIRIGEHEIILSNLL